MFGGFVGKEALIVDTGSGGGRVDLEGNTGAASHFHMGRCWPCAGASEDDVRDFEHMLHASWQAAFTELRAFPDEHPVVVTVPQWASDEVCRSVVRLLFDKEAGFKATDVHVVNQQVMALDSALLDTGDGFQGTSAGPLTTCVVLDCGFDGARAVAIRDRKVVECVQTDVGGRDVAKVLRNAFDKAIMAQPQREATPAEEDLQAAIEHVKEEYCYIASDFDAEVQEAKAGRVTGIMQELANTDPVAIRDELFTAPEVFFRPSIANKEGKGVHEIVSEVMSRDAWGAGYGGRVLLAGGSTLFHGFTQRLEKELSELQSGRELHVIATDNRDHAPYLGALNAARQPQRFATWITRAEYEKYGPEIIASKES